MRTTHVPISARISWHDLSKGGVASRMFEFRRTELDAVARQEQWLCGRSCGGG